MRPFDERRVLLVVSGGIAAYKVPGLVRRLQEVGAVVDVVLTESARNFVGSATFEALTGRAVPADLWETPLAHVELGRACDVVVVAPATANVLARMAGGLADDLATTTLLAADAPVVVSPAMNQRMWRHPATRRNVDRLIEDGVRVLEPGHGALAEGEVGPGRLPEPPELLAEIGRVLEPDSRLEGRKVVVTAGPTRAHLDPVRFLTNRSTGRMGYALAATAWRRGARVVLISGPGSVAPPYGPRLVRVDDAPQMLEALREELKGADLLLMAAAVADYRPVERADRKLKKAEGALEIRLEPGPDLLGETRQIRRDRGIATLGFALETHDGLANARRKLEEKELDWIALNEAGRDDTGFESETNRVSLLDRSGGVDELPLLHKQEVAERILDHIESGLED